MHTENKHEEGCGHMEHPFMEGLDHKEFMIAKLEKKAAMLKIELEFVEKMKALVIKKTEEKSK
jgi:hypothetical protein